MRIYLTFCFCFVAYFGFSQKLHHQTLGAQGGVYGTQGNIILKQSVGQISVIKGGTAFNVILQQGFQQSLMSQFPLVNAISNVHVSIYPNPFKGDLNLQFSTESPKDLHIYLYNMFGVLIYQTIKNNPQTSFNFDFNELPAGSYVLHLQSSNFTYSKTLIKL
jgi:hypothetical protein